MVSCKTTAECESTSNPGVMSDFLERERGAGVHCDGGVVLHPEVQRGGCGAGQGGQGEGHGRWH